MDGWSYQMIGGVLVDKTEVLIKKLVLVRLVNLLFRQIAILATSCLIGLS
jgi:hypothetical protein